MIYLQTKESHHSFLLVFMAIKYLCYHNPDKKTKAKDILSLCLFCPKWLKRLKNSKRKEACWDRNKPYWRPMCFHHIGSQFVEKETTSHLSNTCYYINRKSYSVIITLDSPLTMNRKSELCGDIVFPPITVE